MFIAPMCISTRSSDRKRRSSILCVCAWHTLKQRAVFEFLVAEKEIVGNIHKWLCAVYGSSVINRAPFDAGFRELRLQKVEKRHLCSENMAT